jgi:hypothetical protein
MAALEAQIATLTQQNTKLLLRFPENLIIRLTRRSIGRKSTIAVQTAIMKTTSTGRTTGKVTPLE